VQKDDNIFIPFTSYDGSFDKNNYFWTKL